MKLLDLSKFEKIAQDDRTATMRHKDGHTMTILIARLPKLHQEQLRRIRLAEGGEASATDEDDSEADAAPAQPGMAAAEALNANPPAAPQMPGDLSNAQNAAATPAQAVQMAGQGADIQQKIDTAAAAGKQQIAQEQASNAQAIMDRQNATIQEMKQHTDDLAKWTRENPRDSNQYWKSMTDDQKTGTALGLFLGGFAGPNNPALNYLNHQIDRNIADQQENYQRQRNVFGAYQQLYGDENVSTALTKVSMNDKLLAEADRLTALLGTPQAAANNAKFKANTLKENYDNLQKAAFIHNALPNGPGPEAPAGAPGPAMPQAPMNPETKAGKPAYGPESANVQGVYQPKPLLNPHAGRIASGLAARANAGDPMAAAQLPRVQEQYARAQKADEVLSRAEALYNTLAANRDSIGGWISRQVGGVDTGGEGIIGTAASMAGKYAGDVFSGFRDLGDNSHEQEMNRSYNTAAQELSDMLRSVYPSIGGGELHSKMSGILPDKNDTPEQVKDKMKAFEDLIRTSGEFNFLKDNHMMER